MASPKIKCPEPPTVVEGSTLDVTYTIENCAGRSVTVTFNGAPLAGFTDACSGGNGTVTFKAPQRVAGEANSVFITVTDSDGREDGCTIAVVAA